METKTVLRIGVDNQMLVQVVRQSIEIPGIHLVGIPIAVGRTWLVLSNLNDALSLDGFTALRISDITAVKLKFRRRSFYVRSIQHKRLPLPGLPKLDLDSESEVLRSMQRLFSLIVVNREIVNTGASEIGRLTRISSRTVTMQLIDPSAHWIRGTETFRARDITRIGFGGGYEESLAGVAGLKDPKWR